MTGHVETGDITCWLPLTYKQSLGLIHVMLLGFRWFCFGYMDKIGCKDMKKLYYLLPFFKKYPIHAARSGQVKIR